MLTKEQRDLIAEHGRMVDHGTEVRSMKTPAEWQKWLEEQMPRDGDHIAVALHKMGTAWGTVLGSCIDLMLDMQALRDELRAELAKLRGQT